MNTKVVPEPSARCTAATAVSGSFRPGFRAAILGSFQVAMSPENRPASTAPVRRSRFEPIPGRFTIGTTPPITVGNCSSIFAASFGPAIGASEAPKSTVRAITWFCPALEPSAW